jgi:hypothetical protein
MKTPIKKNSKPAILTKTRLLIKDGEVTIHHHQTVRQSRDYNSAEASYGVTFTVNQVQLEEGLLFAEKTVQRKLLAKTKEQATFLGA